MAIYQLAFEQRLQVLDVDSRLNSWYQALPPEEQSAALTAAERGEPAQTLAVVLAPWLVNWLFRRLLRAELLADFSYGACQYPEVWDAPTNATDRTHARQLGMNTVRIGEFFWDRLEPQEGHYQLTYLENLLTGYQRAGLKVILGIPSPTPPRWFTQHYPAARVVNADGQVEAHGSRQHVCTNNPIFRRKVYQLTHQIARVAARFENVIGIQIDNEFKCHVDQCFCPTCRQLWPEWLRAKYQTIDRLNAAWGTAVWSERYPDFEAVVLPTKTPFAHNSGLDNAFRQFTADTVNDFCAGIAQILIAETTIPLTHNSSLNFNLMNDQLFSQLDIVGFDTYPTANQYWNFPINLDRWRNLKTQPEMLLLETATSHVGYTGHYVAPNPRGFLLPEIFLGYAAGLKSFLFWPFRAQPNGIEQPHSAVVTQTGSPDLGYEDVVRGGQLLAQYRPFLTQSRVVRAKIALVYSDNAKRAMRVESGGIYEYRTQITQVYRALTQRGLAVELVSENADLNAFDCVLMPFIRNVNDWLLAKLRAFAQRGGQLIIGPLTGDRTADMGWLRGTNGLGALGEWLGVTNVVQFLSAAGPTQVRVQIGNQMDVIGGLVTLFETAHPMAGVTTVAPVAGTRNLIYQHHNVYYLGGLPVDPDNSPLWDTLVARVIKPRDADQPFLDTANGLFKYRRESPREVQFYLANLALTPATFSLHQRARDATGRVIAAGTHQLASYQYQLLRFEK